MNRLQQKIPLVMASIVLIGAIIGLYQGFPARIIVPGASLMLVFALLHALWVKDSLARALGLGAASTLAFLWFAWYFLHLPLFAVVFGAIFLLGMQAFNALWLKRSIAKAREYLVNWVTINGGQLLEFEHRLSTGPFGGWRGRTDLYFQFVARDRQQQSHVGWMRFDCGLLSNRQPKIKWVETPSNISE